MSIQILQYEFLGPINLDEWGPPMEKVVFLIFSRKKDSFHIIYAGVCEKTEEKDYFIKNEDYKNWTKVSGFKNPLYLAILPMFDSSPEARMIVRNKIIRHYRPACNATTELNKKPDYTIRTKSDLDNSKPLEKKIEKSEEKISCPCCGSEMKIDKVLENTTIVKCSSCGLSDTRLNS